MELVEKFQEAASILIDNYSSLKYHQRFTLWGVCYFWDGEKASFSERPTDLFDKVIPAIFEAAKKTERRIHRPSLYIPKSRSVSDHYSLLCARNQSLVSHIFTEIAGQDFSNAKPIVKDSLLLTEAAETFVKLKNECVIPETADFFDFLAGYNLNRTYSEDSVSGQYLGLLERLAVRFESHEEVFPALSHIIHEQLYKDLSEQHYASLKASEPKPNKDLAEAHRKYSEKTNKTSPPLPQRINSNTPSSVLGNRLVRTGVNSDNLVDWKAYAERMAQRGKINFNPEAIIQQQLLNMVISYYIPRYKTSPDAALLEIKEKIKEATNPEEAKALNTALKLLEQTKLFDTCDTINHSMVVNRRN